MRQYKLLINGDNFYLLRKNIRCDPSSESSRRDGSGDGSQHIVSMRKKK